jgi:putative DNA primase/helicase
MRFFERNIPQELKDKKQWVAYFKKKETGISHLGKVMISPRTYHHAKSNDPTDWTDFYSAHCFAATNGNLDGLAFVLTKGIVFIDIDNSIDNNGVISEFASKMLNEFPKAYAEKSCSGTGIHILLKGKLPEGVMKRNDNIGLEIYETKRFCCITGDMIAGHNELIDYTEKVGEVAKRYLGVRKPNPIARPVYMTPTLDDQRVIEKALRSRSGDKFSRLFSGDITGYATHSSADLALVNMISFYTQNPDQIDAIFRTSGLMRDKWDSPRGDSTYGRVTIETSLANTVRRYEMN